MDELPAIVTEQLASAVAVYKGDRGVRRTGIYVSEVSPYCQPQIWLPRTEPPMSLTRNRRDVVLMPEPWGFIAVDVSRQKIRIASSIVGTTSAWAKYHGEGFSATTTTRLLCINANKISMDVPALTFQQFASTASQDKISSLSPLTISSAFMSSKPR